MKTRQSLSFLKKETSCLIRFPSTSFKHSCFPFLKLDLQMPQKEKTNLKTVGKESKATMCK